MVHHFEMGIWLLFLAYTVSVVGSTIGLACTAHSRAAGSTGVRIAWLVLASLSIGGVGIWLMHFIAILGFSTPGHPIRFEVVRTLLSAVLSVAAVFAGLLLLGVQKQFATWRLVVAGVVTGLAVNIMHFTGMWALNVKGTITYNGGLVALSVLVAIIAATAGLWCAVTLDRFTLRIAGGLVFGVAATAMHYIAMAAVEMHLNPNGPDPSGVEVFSFLFPVFVLAVAALALPIVALLTAAQHAEDEPRPIAISATS